MARTALPIGRRVCPGAQGAGVKFDAVKWSGVLLVSFALMAGSAWAARIWQVNAYDHPLSAEDASHQPVLTDMVNANAALVVGRSGQALCPYQSCWVGEIIRSFTVTLAG